jgi:GrpB-like predicted nucleotidyltransferase (UPF0157 family)
VSSIRPSWTIWPGSSAGERDVSEPSRFAKLGTRLRAALGEAAIRIDHIGSTSVAGLAAKAVIDIQVCVAGLEPAGPFGKPLAGLGFVYRADSRGGQAPSCRPVRQ